MDIDNETRAYLNIIEQKPIVNFVIRLLSNNCAIMHITGSFIMYLHIITAIIRSLNMKNFCIANFIRVYCRQYFYCTILNHNDPPQ